METLLRISLGLDRLVSGIGRLAAWLTLPMMLVILYDVGLRHFGGQGSTQLQELEWHLHGALFLLCFGYAYLADSHVRIELVRDRLSLRTRAWIELVGCLLFLMPYCTVVIYFGIDFAYRAFETGEVSSALTGLSHRWIIKSVIPVAIALLLLAGVAVLLRSVVFLFGPERLRRAAGTHVGTHHADMADVEADERRE